MKQLIIGGTCSNACTEDLSKIAPGAVGIYYVVDGLPVLVKDKQEQIEHLLIALGRSKNNGGTMTYPLYKTFRWVKGEYSPAKAFKAKITTSFIRVNKDKYEDYYITIVKKGVEFNKRNKTHIDIPIKNSRNSSSELAQLITDIINKNKEVYKLEAENTGSEVTITSIDKGVDYNIMFSDTLSSFEFSVEEKGEEAYLDDKYVKNLASMCAADAGFEYTYSDNIDELYPNYKNISTEHVEEEKGYTMFTLRFAEPKVVKTIEDVVSQVIHIVFPTDSPQISKFEEYLTILSDEQENTIKSN